MWRCVEAQSRASGGAGVWTPVSCSSRQRRRGVARRGPVTRPGCGRPCLVPAPQAMCCARAAKKWGGLPSDQGLSRLVGPCGHGRQACKMSDIEDKFVCPHSWGEPAIRHAPPGAAVQTHARTVAPASAKSLRPHHRRVSDSRRRLIHAHLSPTQEPPGTAPTKVLDWSSSKWTPARLVVALQP